jgi:hypothetical protein
MSEGLAAEVGNHRRLVAEMVAQERFEHVDRNACRRGSFLSYRCHKTS